MHRYKETTRSSGLVIPVNPPVPEEGEEAVVTKRELQGEDQSPGAVTLREGHTQRVENL